MSASEASSTGSVPPEDQSKLGEERPSSVRLYPFHMPPADRRFETCLFDLDGTLIDSTDLITSAFAHTFRTHRRPEPPDDVLRAGFGTPLRTQLKTFARDAEEVEAMAVTYREFHRENHDELLRPFAGVREQIATLHERGVKLAIVTSKGREAARLGLLHCGLLEYFDVLVTPADVTACKPDPAPVLAALEELDAGGRDDRVRGRFDPRHPIWSQRGGFHCGGTVGSVLAPGADPTSPGLLAGASWRDCGRPRMLATDSASAGELLSRRDGLHPRKRDLA